MRHWRPSAWGFPAGGSFAEKKLPSGGTLPAPRVWSGVRGGGSLVFRVGFSWISCSAEQTSLAYLARQVLWWKSSHQRFPRREERRLQKGIPASSQGFYFLLPWLIQVLFWFSCHSGLLTKFLIVKCQVLDFLLGEKSFLFSRFASSVL